MREGDVSQRLLDWYDRNARQLPWRVGPADRAAGLWPDPYRVWLSEIMLQQTTVAAVGPYFAKFTRIWPTVQHLASADDDAVMAAWAGLGYYARARNLLACARQVVRDHAGVFPMSEAGLLTLPGIGPYTAAAIAAIAYDHPAVVMDGNIERVMSRLHAETEPLPGVKPVLRDRAAQHTPATRPGDHAQALMDLGATICTPRSPSCGNCPLNQGCAARDQGIAADLPTRRPKVPKPMRQGHVFAARDAAGNWLLERRPAKGLLGGMLGFPGSDWAQEAAPTDPPVAANWQVLPTDVRHTFTHFHLRLTVHVARLSDNTHLPDDLLTSGPGFDPRSLPTVMRKVCALASSALSD